MFNHHHSLAEELFLSMFIADQGLELNFDEFYCICLKKLLSDKNSVQNSRLTLNLFPLANSNFPYPSFLSM